MTATDTLRSSLQAANHLASKLLADMRDEPLARPQADKGNHPYWLLGHIVVSQAWLLDQYILRQPNRHQDWVPKFAPGSRPANTLDGGPSFDELLAALDRIQSASLEYIATLSDKDLGRPCRNPDGVGPRFETIADCLSAMSLHASFHAGQAADARRAAGRMPLFM